MGALQPWHLIVILVIVLVVFGPGKLPELGKALGDGMRELKRATKDDSDAPATTAATASAPAAPVATAAPAAPVATVASAAPAPNGVTATAVAPVPTAVAVDTKCSRCQATVAAGTRFCGSCGAPVTA